MIRVFLADDHGVLRTGIRKLLENEPDFRVVGEASDGRQVLLAPKDQWDILLLDIALPKVSGIEVLRRLREEHPRLRVLILSMFPEEQYAARLIAEGAAGYLAKDRPGEELLKALRTIASGGTWIDAASKEQLRNDKDAASPPHTKLTAREYQVFTLLISGNSVTNIAAELNLSVPTVSNHLHRIKEKLHATTVAEIVTYAHRAGLVGP